MMYSDFPSTVSRVCGEISFWFLVQIFYVLCLGQSDVVGLSILVNVCFLHLKRYFLWLLVCCSINTVAWVWLTWLCVSFTSSVSLPVFCLFCYWGRCVSSCNCGFVYFFSFHSIPCCCVYFEACYYQCIHLGRLFLWWIYPFTIMNYFLSGIVLSLWSSLYVILIQPLQFDLCLNIMFHNCLLLTYLCLYI